MLASEIAPLDSVRERLAREVAIRVDGAGRPRRVRGARRDLLAPPRRSPGLVRDRAAGDAGACACQADVSSQIRVRPSSTLIAEVEQIVGRVRCRCGDRRARTVHSTTSTSPKRDAMPETLDFEEPIAVLLKEIEALERCRAPTRAIARSSALRRRVETVRADLYATLTPWQRVLVARHPNRPGLEDFIQRLFPDFVEIHGDRRFADDHAIMTGFAEYHGQPVLLVGHVKGGDTKEKIFRNFGYARPEGYRKALRAMRLAEKFRRPIIVFVDTPAAYPGHRVRGARRRRSDRREPARHDAARHADRRDRQRRRRQRRRARHRGRRPGADAGVRDLQRDPAGGLRRHPLARRRRRRSRRPRR